MKLVGFVDRETNFRKKNIFHFVAMEGNIIKFICNVSCQINHFHKLDPIVANSIQNGIGVLKEDDALFNRMMLENRDRLDGLTHLKLALLCNPVYEDRLSLKRMPEKSEARINIINSDLGIHIMKKTSSSHLIELCIAIILGDCRLEDDEYSASLKFIFDREDTLNSVKVIRDFQMNDLELYCK